MIDEREEEITPKQALDRAIAFAVFCGSIRNGPKGKPGEIISKQSALYRKALQGLTSDDVQDVRPSNTQNFG